MFTNNGAKDNVEIHFNISTCIYKLPFSWYIILDFYTPIPYPVYYNGASQASCSLF